MKKILLILMVACVSLFAYDIHTKKESFHSVKVIVDISTLPPCPKNKVLSNQSVSLESAIISQEKVEACSSSTKEIKLTITKEKNIITGISPSKIVK